MDKVIRNIPDDVAETLKKEAREKGLTLEAYIRSILIELARNLRATSEKNQQSSGAL